MSSFDASFDGGHLSLPNNTGLVPVRKDERSKAYRIIAVTSILISVFLERIAYYAVVSNLPLNLQNVTSFNWNSGDSVTLMLIFEGLAYIFTLICAILSDAKLGRAKTTFFGNCVHPSVVSDSDILYL